MKTHAMSFSPKQHLTDTIKGGDYYNIPALVEVMVNGAMDDLDWMIDGGGARIRPWYRSPCFY